MMLPILNIAAFYGLPVGVTARDLRGEVLRGRRLDARLRTALRERQARQ
jgi:hypothetical protein